MRASLLAVLVVACGAGTPAPDANTSPVHAYRVVGGHDLDGAPIELAVLDGRFVPPSELPAGARRWDVQGATIVPAFVDAHVHLSYDPVAAEHAAGGIAVAIDLASPIEALDGPFDPLRVLRAGPMITSPNGYPLDSWGRAGYGIECTDAASCAARVDALVARGAALIKVPIEATGGLDDASLAAIVARAHARDRLVVAHALGVVAVRRAVMAGVDVLAHTPIELLDEATLASLEGRAVISTLGAFGGSADAIENLRAMRAHGVDVVYGTDLGNTRTTGIDPRELALLGTAGLDARAIVAAATITPAERFGLDDHGSLTPGHAASFLVYRADVVADPIALAHPDAVALDGEIRENSL